METEIINERQDSIEISRTAKGLCTWKIKRYYDFDKTDYKDVMLSIEKIDRELNEKFGEKNGENTKQ